MNCAPFTELADLLPCLVDLVAGPHPVPDQSISYFHFIFSIAHFSIIRLLVATTTYRDMI
jgi:hypothetical protein